MNTHCKTKMENRYNWQHPQWPNFEYDLRTCQAPLYAYIKETALLSGAIAQLTKDSVSDALVEIMVTEAIKTSEIEGEVLEVEDVRSSIRRNLGLPYAKQIIHDHRASGISSLMLDVRATFLDQLTKQKLCEWHRMVMHGSSFAENEIGCWRKNQEPMQIVSGPLGRERVYFEAPPVNYLEKEMDAFIQWFNATELKQSEHVDNHTMCGPVRAALAHLYFESIHPFIDGNGRIGRAIVEKALSQDLGAAVLYSVSAIIQKRRKEYYDMLHKNSGYSIDVTEWVCFFVNLIYEAQRASQDTIHFVLKKTKFWQMHINQVSKRQEKVLERMFKEGPSGFEGGINAQKYMNITGCSKATATRDLTDLLEKGCIYRLPGSGPTTRYDISFVDDPGAK